MPTYEYKCDACGHGFEKFQSITAAPIKTCPSCGKRKVRRLIGTGAGLIFKGNGFYITDYRSESYKDAAKSDTGAGAADAAASSGAAASDAKPADAKPAGAKPAANTAPAAQSKPAAPAKAKSGKK